jgi:hypothetical protein
MSITVLGFRVVDSSRTMISSVLVLGPGDGEEIQEFAADHPCCHITFIGASDRFCDILREKYVNLTPFCRQEEKPVSSGEKGELVWMKRENERSMIGSSRSML